MKKIIGTLFFIWITIDALDQIYGLSTKPEHLTPTELLTIILDLLGPICVFQYVFEKKWLPTVFWKGYFLIYVCFNVFEFSQLMQVHDGLLRIVITSIILFLPMCFVSFMLAFKKGNK